MASEQIKDQTAQTTAADTDLTIIQKADNTHRKMTLSNLKTYVIGGIENQISGVISGNIFHASPSAPPKVSSGLRDVLGVIITETADVTLATTDAFGVCSQSFSDYLYTWMKVLVDNTGTYKYIPSYDSQPVASLTDIAVSSISVAGGVATCLTADTTGLAVGHMVIVKGSDIGYLIGEVTSISAGVNFTVKTSASNATYSAGTYSAKYRIATPHGTGTITGINTDADIVKYSPSPEFNPVYNGYYRGVDGDIVTDSTGVWRDIGAFYIDASGNVTEVISYKSGFDKNDNDLHYHGYAGHGSTDTKIPYFVNLERAWGSDYTALSDTTNGLRVLLNNDGKVNSGFIFAGNGSSTPVGGITLNSTELTTSFQSLINKNTIMCGLYLNGLLNAFSGDSFSGYMSSSGDYFRLHTNGQAPSTYATSCGFKFSMEVKK